MELELGLRGVGLGISLVKSWYSSWEELELRL